MPENYITEQNDIIAELEILDDGFAFASSISAALASAESMRDDLDKYIQENMDSIARLTPDCDKLDYALAAGCGALCGIIDIFLVGKPKDSVLGDITDEWFGERTKDFARLFGWGDNGDIKDAIEHLEKRFKIPYDQRGAGDIANSILDLTPSNHHFKSLGHNPTLLGLFFSILDQFTGTSHFVSEGELVSIQQVGDGFELRGNSIPSKLFCGFVNWLGHLISDMSGSSTSKGRGMGIPSPIWSWVNDVIAIKRSLHYPAGEFDRNVNEIAVKVYTEGFDLRFQTAQLIPVFINECLVRVIYSIRRLVKFYSDTEKEDRSFKALWKSCEPFSNASVKRMLTVAHGTFCLFDLSDALARGVITGAGSFNVTEFFLRLNIAGVGRFVVSLYGELSRSYDRGKQSDELTFRTREKIILDDYIEGLTTLSSLYDDRDLIVFVSDLQNSELYIQAFQKSVELAELRKVPNEDILKSKNDIDQYFDGGSNK